MQAQPLRIPPRTVTQTELIDIMQEHHLRNRDVAQIVRCTERMVECYRAGMYRFPPCRLDLLKLHLGLKRPAWTPARRRARLRKEIVG